MVLCSSLLQGKEAAAPSKPQRSRQQTGDKMADDDNRVSKQRDVLPAVQCSIEYYCTGTVIRLEYLQEQL